MLSKLVKTHCYIFLISIVLFNFQQPLIAQDVISNKGTINVGFEGGVQFTAVDDPYMPVSDAGVGYSLGPYIEYFLSDMVKIRAGINFDNRAFELKDMGNIVGDSGYVGQSSYYDILEKYKVNYLTIPLSIIYIKGSDKFKFFIQGTLYYSLFLNAKQTGYTNVYISEEDAWHFNFEDFPELSTPGLHEYPPIKQTFNTSDIGINVFLGGVFFIKSNIGITLSPGFTYSFGNVWEYPERKANWSRLYKINAGIIYKLK